MATSRPLRQFEKYFINASHNVQMALKLASKEYVEQVVPKFVNACAGFHLKSDGKRLIYTGPSFKVAKLPSSITSTEEAAHWIVENAAPDFSQSLSTIACNDSIVVMNSNHLCCDGGFLTYMLEKCAAKEMGHAAMFPQMIDHVFAKQLAAAPPPETHFDNSESLSRIPWNRDSAVKETDLTSQVVFRRKASDLQVFDRATGKVRGLTESLWTSLSLTLSAMSNTFHGIGSNTCVNLRQMLNHESIDLSISNSYTRLNILAKGVTPNMTLSDAFRLLRKDFETKKSNGSFFTALKLNLVGFPADPNPGSFGQVTNVGPLKLHHPITDIWIQQSVFCRAAERCFSLLSFSVIDPPRNDIVCALRYAPSVTPLRDAVKVAKSVEYIMTSIPTTTPISEVIAAAQKIQATV